MEMAATISSSPRTVEEIFKDYSARRAGIVRALTYDVDEFYSTCDPEKENLCLYGHPNETWEVTLPAEEVPPELPEPALGINFARDGMHRRDWLSLVAVHTDSWLLAVAFYFGARLNRNESLLLAVSTLAYCAAYDRSAGHAVFVVLSVTCFHFLLIGALLATCCWFLTNTYLREEAPNSHVVEQRVEWLYAFDVHCNSFFPLFVMLYVIHYFLSPLLVAHGFISTLLSNLLFMTAASYYHYLNFLGYDVLPFLERTTFFLYPIGIVIILSPIFTLSGFNPSRYFMNLYFSQWS